jgi:hypothetical protein
MAYTVESQISIQSCVSVSMDMNLWVSYPQGLFEVLRKKVGINCEKLSMNQYNHIYSSVIIMKNT